MKVHFTPRGRRAALAMAKWWRANRPLAADLFERELATATRQIEQQPELVPVYETVRGRAVRRALLPKTEQHVYYSVDEATETVVIHVVWGARRGRGPEL